MNRQARRAAKFRTVTTEYPKLTFAIAGEHNLNPQTVAHLKELRQREEPLKGLDVLSITFDGDSIPTLFSLDFYAATETLLCLLGNKPYRFHFEDEQLQSDLIAKLDVLDRRNRELGRCPPRELLDGNATNESGTLSLAKQTLEAERKHQNLLADFPEDFRLDITKLDRWSVKDFVTAYAPNSITPDAARQAVQRKLWEIRKQLHGADRENHGQPGKAIADITKNEVEQLHHFFIQKWGK